MVDFAGWDMPVQYPTGILAEHQAVRSACGLFDLSHMGRVFLRGPDALALAQECCTRDLSRIRPGEAAYSVVLDESEVLFVFNASNRLSDIHWFEAQRDRLRLDVTLDDRTLQTALIGVQGPTSQTILQGLCTADLEALPGYAFIHGQVAQSDALISRTGYTGEDGFELMVSAESAEAVWSTLLNQAAPCGLGARDTLRTEAGFALYGHDIDETTNPYEARLGWVVSLGKPGPGENFVGREALATIKANGPVRKLVGLQVEQGGVPRPGFAILHENRRVGSLTSGTFSPTLKNSIAMGYVPTELSNNGQPLSIETRGKMVGAQVAKLPFVPHRSRPRARM
jgi:aminomethyltransferase